MNTMKLVEASSCQTLPVRSSQQIVTHNGSYRYYYGGYGDYSLGSTVAGGSNSPDSGQSYSLTTGTSRGGFGHSFSDDPENWLYFAFAGGFLLVAGSLGS